TVDRKGLYCRPGGFHIDPYGGADRAVITHGHADHARPGHAHVLATRETLAVMTARLGTPAKCSAQALAYGERLTIGEVAVTLFPAGHVLGSAQVLIEWKGVRAVISGDYKRSPDPTCPPFEPVPCHLFITEATFALPVFQHGDANAEAAKLLRSREQFPDRAHVVGVYGRGKCQRLIALLRALGYQRPIYLHGALAECCALYESFGVRLGELKPATGAPRDELRGEIVLAPPSAIADRWSRRLPDPVTAFASGWMRIRARARQRGVELPLVISDHADWRELIDTIEETGAEEVWVTHGREDALLHHIQTTGRRGRALSLIGREDDEE
ncbi:MAG TPA: ligase-associated DNA damage response exonuclease, partial [Methyloceanibacter sp.]|nr:ligase-associated DNA damage response exonuclease [Methyloceanibacter sp.]